ncbi:MAG: TetR/AcrR family transcriptional regulator [Acidobacteriota bacterium]
MGKGESTRSAILCEALSITSRIGLEGLSIGALAKEVGLSKSGLFSHFGSKEGLQLDVLALAAARFVEVVLAPAIEQPRGEPRVVAMFENWMQWEASELIPGGCVFISTANELDDRPGPVRDRLVGYQTSWLDSIARATRLAIEEGHFRADLDVRQFAYDLYAILLAYHHFGRLIQDPRATERAYRSFEALLDASRA